MRVGKSIRNSIDEWLRGDLDSSMLHACNAIDGTAKKLISNSGSNGRFTKLLRDNYDILGPMGLPGIDIVKTRFPISLRNPKATGGRPDLADVIYGIHRCSHGHGEDLPDGFELIEDARGPVRLTRCEVRKGTLRISDRVIFGMIAVAVLSEANIDQKVPEGYFLTFGASEPLPINEWWGRHPDFLKVIAREPMPLVELDFGDWMN